MAEFKINRLRFTWAGPWIAETTYAKDAVVSFNGFSYVCIFAHTSSLDFNDDLYNVLEDESPFPYWTKMLEGHTWIGTWTPEATYNLNNIVLFGGSAYICTQGHTAGQVFDEYYWNIYGVFDSWKHAWSADTLYGVGDIVKYGAVVYRCITAHTSTSATTTLTATGFVVNAGTATLTYATQTAQPFVVGASITLDGFDPLATNTPTLVNGTFTVLTCTTTQLTFALTGTYTVGTLGTVEGPSLLGLETDFSKWAVIVSNIRYLTDWESDVRYTVNDVVKLGPELWVCVLGHLSGADFDEANWDLWLPGVEFGGTWDVATEYQPGEVVIYGGYSYISNTVNNIGNIPSTDAIDWTLFTQGYEMKQEWSNIVTYKIGSVVRESGQLFVSIADSLNQRPSLVTLSKTYQSAGSSGAVISVNNVTSIMPGMTVLGVGFTRGQIVKSVGAGFVTLNEPPDGVPVDGQSLSFAGINFVYWKLLVPGISWRYKWAPAREYFFGDTAGWKNATYRCVKYHTSSTVNRPDNDTTSSFWVLFLQNDKFNAMNDAGDMVSFSGDSSIPINIGPEAYVLKSVDHLPTWSTIFITPNVYYVATNGVDAPDRGITWDVPWRTIKYATDRVSAGVLNQNAKYLLVANKEYIAEEAVSWLSYRIKASIPPFSPTMPSKPGLDKTRRDARYLVDAIIYDISRGGNSQVVAYTLAFFDLQRVNKFATDEVYAQISYFISIVNYIFTVVADVLANTPPALNYQALNISWFSSVNYNIGDVVFYNGEYYSSLTNGNNNRNPEDEASIYWVLTVEPSSFINQIINVTYVTEPQVPATVTALQAIIINAFTTGSSSVIPPANQGATATIMIKSGTYDELIPITVPANTSLNGDELRGVTVRPANSVNTLCTRSTGGGVNLFTVGSTNNMFDGTVVQFVSLNPISSASGLTYINTVFGNVTNGQNYYVIGSTVTATQFSVRLFGESLATVALGTPGNGYSQGLLASVTAPQTPGGVTAVVDPVIDLLTGIVTEYTITDPGTGYTIPPVVTVVAPTPATAVYLNAGASPTDIVVDSIINVIYLGMQISGTGFSTQKVVAIEENTPNFAQTTVTLSAAPDSTPLGAVTFTDIGIDAVPGVTTISQQDIPVNLTTNNGFMYVYGGGALGDMIRVRNGTTLRNMTFAGMLGTLSELNEYGTRRPTGGSCVALDPGTGPDDTSAWIIRKSPYIQNVTNFGTGAVGMKVDSTLHNGGLHSMTCNDFTQILSDGIGVWVTGGEALVEAVSVFAYFCYAGYLSENGGRSRATNGNSSYGEYGVLSEGYDVTEIPVTGLVNNRALQATAAAVSSFGANAQILKIQYSNAGSSYFSAVTNMLKYSNNLLGSNWVNDGNVILAQSIVSPFGASDAWSLLGNTSITDTSYLYQNITVARSGGSYTNISGTNVDGTGINATFDIVVNSSSYVVSVNNGGTGYVTGNQIRIDGTVFGGRSGPNDLTIFVQSIQPPSSILTAIGTGQVPAGSNNYYTASIHAKKGTSNVFDLYAIWSGGPTTMAQAFTYTWSSNTITASGVEGASPPPILTQAVPLGNGWYRMSFVIADASGLNTNLQFRIYPRSRLGVTGTTLFYGAQVELGQSGIDVNYYAETSSNRYSAYANYSIIGAGSGAVAVGTEIRSGAVFQEVVASKGSGFITATNNAQGGVSAGGYITLAQSDVAEEDTYIGMRLLVTSGLGAGQYGYISSFDPVTKNAYVLRESFAPLLLIGTATSTNLISLDFSADVNTLYVNQQVQFLPKSFTTTVTLISQSQVEATETLGGLNNTITVTSTARLALNMPISFTGTTFGQITVGYVYYIINIVDDTHIQISTSYGGVVWTLVNGTGSMAVNYPAQTGYLTGPTINMLPGYAIQFTGAVLGNIVVGQYYYINDVIDATTFTLANTLVNITVTNTFATTTISSVVYSNVVKLTGTPDVSAMSALNPIYFTGVSFGGLTANLKYYISRKLSATEFTVSETIKTVTATATAASSNLITVNSTTGFVVDNPVIFSGQTFGGLVTEQVYYVSVINNLTTFTVSSVPGGPAVTLTTREGSVICRTTAASATLTTSAGSLLGATTSAKLVIESGTGSMTGTFQTPIFGGITAATTYYIKAITPGTPNKFTISTAPGGAEVNLSTASGYMQVAHLGWDNINPGTLDTTLFDSTSVYFIEPRIEFYQPGSNQVLYNDNPLPSAGSNYKSISYGNRKFMAVPQSGSTAAISLNGADTWTTISLPASAFWTRVKHGNNYWVIISQAGFGIAGSRVLYTNSDGLSWQTAYLPSISAWTSLEYGNGTFVALSSGASYWNLTPTVVLSSGTGAKFTVSNFGTRFNVVINDGGLGVGNGNYAISDTLKILGTQVGGTTPANDIAITVTGVAGGLITQISATGASPGGGNAAPAYSLNQGATWQSGSGLTNLGWAKVTYGNGKFVTVAEGTRTAAYSTDGVTWTVLSTALPTTTTWSSVTFGNNKFVAISSINAKPAYSLDGITWYESPYSISADYVKYGNGVYIALKINNSQGYKSEDGIAWKWVTFDTQAYADIEFGFPPSNKGTWVTISGGTGAGGAVTNIFAGIKAQGRASVSGGEITAVTLWEPGSNYQTTPAITYTDPNNTSDAEIVGRIGDGVLAGPSFVSRGTNYNTSSTTITIRGQGYADNYQLGLNLSVYNLSSLPAPGDNLQFAGNDETYKVTDAVALYGTQAPFIQARISISPGLFADTAPEHASSISIREKYSQVRLTNHDFLNIGYGSVTQSGYPGFPEATNLNKANYTVESNDGRVFYSSTDQDGNFSVGGLFGVEQATGIVTLSASQFGLTGLSELKLGGVSVGSNQVIITAFSTDSSFLANSNAILPTQKAIKSYLTGRLSQGGSNTFTGELIAGTVKVGGPDKIGSTVTENQTGWQVKMLSKVMVEGQFAGVDGDLMALDFFLRNGTSKGFVDRRGS